MMTPTAETIFVPLDADTEIQITLSTRYYNGIASDPRVLTRTACITELMLLVEQIRDNSVKVRMHSQLEYPEA